MKRIDVATKQVGSEEHWVDWSDRKLPVLTPLVNTPKYHCLFGGTT